MGGNTFDTFYKGSSTPLQEAFRGAVASARWEFGHGGYTGSIAEKGEVIEIEIPEDFLKSKSQKERARRFSWLVLDEKSQYFNAKVDDKYGPCGAIRIKRFGWYFFGWASS